MSLLLIYSLPKEEPPKEPPAKLKPLLLAPPKLTLRQSSHPGFVTRKKLKKSIFSRQGSRPPPPAEGSEASGDKGLNLVSTWLGKNAKLLPSLEFGFLAQVCKYMLTLSTLSNYS